MSLNSALAQSKKSNSNSTLSLQAKARDEAPTKKPSAKSKSTSLPKGVGNGKKPTVTIAKPTEKANAEREAIGDDIQSLRISVTEVEVEKVGVNEDLKEVANEEPRQDESVNEVVEEFKEESISEQKLASLEEPVEEVKESLAEEVVEEGQEDVEMKDEEPVDQVRDR